LEVINFCSSGSLSENIIIHKIQTLQIKEKQNIQMVDLISQYKKIKGEIDQRLEKILLTARFINGPDVDLFRDNFAK